VAKAIPLAATNPKPTPPSTIFVRRFT
jgi:hypothetical protein